MTDYRYTEDTDKIVRVLLEDGQWYKVEKGSFLTSDHIAVGELAIAGFKFHGRPLGSDMKPCQITGPLSSIRGIMHS